jgi:hypothetical protein
LQSLSFELEQSRARGAEGRLLQVAGPPFAGQMTVPAAAQTPMPPLQGAPLATPL